MTALFSSADLKMSEDVFDIHGNNERQRADGFRNVTLPVSISIIQR
jgi:hypothetical protein